MTTETTRARMKEMLVHEHTECELMYLQHELNIPSYVLPYVKTVNYKKFPDVSKEVSMRMNEVRELMQKFGFIFEMTANIKFGMSLAPLTPVTSLVNVSPSSKLDHIAEHFCHDREIMLYLARKPEDMLDKIKIGRARDLKVADNKTAEDFMDEAGVRAIAIGTVTMPSVDSAQTKNKVHIKYDSGRTESIDVNDIIYVSRINAKDAA